MWRSGASGGIIRSWLGLRQTPGAVVPFEAPALRMARVCDDERDGLIAILRDFANKGAIYIVPWSSLPLMVTMTDHDTALHKGVGERKPSTPAEVRAVVSELALSGALGPEAKSRELQRTQSDRTQRSDVELVLIMHLLTSCGAELASLMVGSTRQVATDTKAAVAAATAAVGVRRQDIYQRISEFAKLLAPVGLMTTEGPIQLGWLRVLHDEIEAFGADCAARVAAGSPELGAALEPIVKSAVRTARLSGTIISMIDYAVLDIGATIRRWNTEQPILKQVIDRLSSILDEWPSLMKAAHDALREPQDNAIARLRPLRAVLLQSPALDASVDRSADNDNAEAATIARVLASRLSEIWSMLAVSRAEPGRTAGGAATR